MNERLVSLILLGVFSLLCSIIAYWRRKAGEAAYAAARTAESDKERDRYCRMAVMAGHRDACRMFCFSRPDLFEEHPPLKPFKSRGIRMSFYGHYSRHGTTPCSTMNNGRSAVRFTSSRMARYTASSSSRPA